MEVMVALGLLSVAFVLVAQISVAHLLERKRTQVRQAVEEVAANVLEEAQAAPADSLTPEWAAGQRLPESLSASLLEPKLTVTVEPYRALPKLKKVTVEIRWLHDDKLAARPVALTGLFGDRAIAQTEKKP
jgi:hypothetical protein